MRKYPIGLQHFREIREGNYTYADKTEYIYHMVEMGLNYFLSRPNGFGKRLFIDTISERFSGREAHFKGRCIYDKRNWDC